MTDASGGLGYEAAPGLAARNPEKAEAPRRGVMAAAPDVDPRFERLDLGSIGNFVGGFAGCGAIDVLVNNASVMVYPTGRTTRDGHEEQFGTTRLGHFALTARLMPALLRADGGARVVSVASLAHVKGRIALDDLQGERRYDPWTAYRRSKLAALIFALEFQRRADAAG